MTYWCWILNECTLVFSEKTLGMPNTGTQRLLMQRRTRSTRCAGAIILYTVLTRVYWLTFKEQIRIYQIFVNFSLFTCCIFMLQFLLLVSTFPLRRTGKIFLTFRLVTARQWRYTNNYPDTRNKKKLINVLKNMASNYQITYFSNCSHVIFVLRLKSSSLKKNVWCQIRKMLLSIQSCTGSIQTKHDLTPRNRGAGQGPTVVYNNFFNIYISQIQNVR